MTDAQVGARENGQPLWECGDCGLSYIVTPEGPAFAKCACDPEQPVAVLADGSRVARQGVTKAERAAVERGERGLPHENCSYMGRLVGAGPAWLCNKCGQAGVVASGRTSA